MAKPTGVSAAEAAAAAAAADGLLTDGIVSQNNKTALGCKRQQILRPARATFNTLCHCPAYLSPTPSPTHPPLYLATPVMHSDRLCDDREPSKRHNIVESARPSPDRERRGRQARRPRKAGMTCGTTAYN